LIGIVGKAGSGKDTVADHLCKEHHFIKMSFAAPLKKVVGDLFDMSHDQLNNQDQKEKEDPRYGFTPRWILQHFGTEVCRRLYPNIWVDYLIRQYEEEKKKLIETKNDPYLHHDQCPWVREVKVVVSDVRFLNEVEAIRKVGGHVWRIVCTNNPKDLEEGSQHASEMEQEKIVVDKTLSAVFGNIDHLCKEASLAVRESDNNGSSHR